MFFQDRQDREDDGLTWLEYFYSPGGLTTVQIIILSILPILFYFLLRVSSCPSWINAIAFAFPEARGLKPKARYTASAIAFATLSKFPLSISMTSISHSLVMKHTSTITGV